MGQEIDNYKDIFCDHRDFGMMEEDTANRGRFLSCYSTHKHFDMVSVLADCQFSDASWEHRRTFPKTPGKLSELSNKSLKIFQQFLRP